MVKDAYYFLIPLLVGAVACFYFGIPLISLLFLLPAGFVAYFFRNPHREIPADPNLVVSPADGKVIKVTSREGATRVSIFLSVFDVHVNRAPIGGRLVRQVYVPGRFHLAYDDRASVENERLELTIEDERSIAFTLIAGLVARRIVPWKKEGDVVGKGDRIALIRFGSRVDIDLPAGCEVLVEQGDRLRGGSSGIARWK
jgi:phosphatidylserine decarboxylase